VRGVILWLLGALIIGGTVAYKVYARGDTDIAYIVAMSACAVIAMAIVAPDFFSGRRREPGDWSQEIQELHSKGEPPSFELRETSAEPERSSEKRDAA
jgi:hypothetical protein